MKPRKTISIYVLLVGVMGLSIVGGILAFQIFSAAIKSQLTEGQKEAVRPIDGVIRQEVVQNLEQRTVVAEAELAALAAPTTAATLTAPLEATATATPAGELTPTQQ